MKLAAVHVRRMPGLPEGFRFADCAPGLNVVLGPNASGKSSFCRALRATLWPAEAFRGEVEADWSTGGQRLHSRRVGRRPAEWHLHGDETAPPVVPDARFRRCFTLALEDLLGEDGTEAEIASEIRRELAAGYDLRRVLVEERAARASSRDVREARKALDAAVHGRQRVQGDQVGLAARERELAELEAQAASARRAQRELRLLERALDAARARAELAAVEERLAGFPPGMERLRGDEEERLTERRERLDEARADREAAREEVAGLRAELRRIDLDERELGTFEREALREHEQSLDERRRELERLEREERLAREECARRARRVGGRADELGAPRLDVAALEDLDALARRREELAARAGALRAELAALEEDGAGRDTERLAQAAYALEQWLEAELRRSAEDGRGARVALATGLAAIALGVAAALGLGAAGWGFVALGVALVVLGARGLAGQTPPVDLSELGIEPPATWSTAAVGRRLRELHTERAAELVAGERRQRAQAARGRLEELVGAARELEDRYRGLLDELRLDAGGGELAVRVLAERLLEHERARDRVAGLRAALEEAGEVLASELAEVDRLMGALRRARVADAGGARAAIRALLADAQAAESARRSLREAERRGARADERVEHDGRELTRLFDELALSDGDEAALVERARRFADWVAERARRDGLRRDLGRIAEELGEHPELRELGVEQAERALAERGEEVERLDELLERVHELKALQERARAGSDLEQALAGEQAAREVLGEELERSLVGRAVDFLLEEVERVHRDAARPDIVRGADEWLGRFTRRRYALELAAPGEEAELGFLVREADGRVLALGELSGGTRAQLVLALRLAVAHQVERGEELPIVLDEALVNSDPERFREVARSLGLLVQGGRQLFYLTADPDELQRLAEALVEVGVEAPCVFRLADERRLSAAAGELATRTLPAVPSPEGRAAEEYARLIGVPRLDPFAPPEAAHLYYLLSDDLGALCGMLREGVEHVGLARRRLAAGLSAAWSAEQRARFELGVRILAAFLDAWRVGRGRPLTEEALREGPVGGLKLEDALVAVARELDRDAQRLLETLEARSDERLKGFREAKARELREDLVARGHFSPEDPLGVEERLERVLSSLAGEIAGGEVRPEEVRARCHALAGWLGEP